MPFTTQYPPNTACCTCATLLTNIVVQPLPQRQTPTDDEGYSEKSDYILSEKHEHYTNETLLHRQTDCCGRYICALCLEHNSRFRRYCPFCPSINTKSTKELEAAEAPPEDLCNEPPAYTLTNPSSAAPPPYSTTSPSASDTGNVKHYLHLTDTLPILSIRYNVPVSILRSYNRIFSDHLLAGLSYIKIPRSHYSGPSLSPDPVQSEEESTLKRFQIKTKCVDYDVAKVYLGEAKWDFDVAVTRWEEDERWESEQAKRGMGMGSGSGSSSSGSGAKQQEMRKLRTVARGRVG